MGQHIVEYPIRDVLDTAAHLAGVDSTDATLIRDGSNTMFQLVDGMVARIGQPGAGTRAAREVAVSRWLAREGIPVVTAIGDVRQDVVVKDRPVTWWALLPSHRPASPAELGRVLHAFHSLPTPDEVDLPVHDPFAGIDQCADGASALPAAEREWLQRRITQLRAEYMEMSDPKVLHGDAWQGNVAVTDSGEAILLDLEHVAVGRQHWDLVQIAADHTDFSRISDAAYRSFVEAYGGFDVTSLADYRTLADIAELRWTCFALSKAAASSRAADEVRHRIACLRGEHPRPWTWSAL